jgi:OmpA-OmpF porin, OOP family
MRNFSRKAKGPALLAILAIAAPNSLAAQQQDPSDPNIVVDGAMLPQAETLVKGPEVKGIIAARSDDKMKVMTADGGSAIIAITDATKIKTSGGIFSSRSALAADSLLNGLPVTVKTMQSGDYLVASQISLRKNDLKTANMIHTGTAQKFEEQTAARQALRGRMGDIDKYNIKRTANVYFDTGKAMLSAGAKSELCAAANEAESMDNALMLVVGYTDAVGSEEFNQQLSEKRAASVINYLQQACRWKPYRMLTPTGMAESDPLASNDTEEGKAQNRRVSVNILVSKGLDGL